MKREIVDVASLACEVGELLRLENHEGSELTILCDVPDEPCFVSGDETQVKQVLTNLGKNAIEAMHGKGTVHIRVSSQEGPVEICFDDEGPGIDPEKIGRIFEPFFTTKESGVGMGLAVCMRIITAHDGTIMASSRKKGGTSMKVLLPGVIEGKEVAL